MNNRLFLSSTNVTKGVSRTVIQTLTRDASSDDFVSHLRDCRDAFGFQIYYMYHSYDTTGIYVDLYV